MSVDPSAARLIRRASFWLAAGLCLLVAHDAVFLVQRGPGQSLVAALREGGHAYWGAASAGLLAGGALAAIVWLLRIAALRSRARLRPMAPMPARGWGRRALGGWIRLFALVAITFAIQENVEHLAGHGHGIGLGALIGPEYPLALPVLAAVTGAAAMLIALVRHHEGELMRRLAAAPAWVGAASRMEGSRRQDRAVVRRGAPMSAHRALRAPPRSPALTIR
jgi:hypothetical protein